MLGLEWCERNKTNWCLARIAGEDLLRFSTLSRGVYSLWNCMSLDRLSAGNGCRSFVCVLMVEVRELLSFGVRMWSPTGKLVQGQAYVSCISERHLGSCVYFKYLWVL